MNNQELTIEITFVSRGKRGSVGTTKVFHSYDHAVNFKRKWTYNEWYVTINGNKPTSEQMNLLNP
jgi:hypothetical protein